MPQSVEPLTLAQVMFSQFMRSRLPVGSVLTAQSLECALDFVSLFLSASLLLSLSLSLSLSLPQK